MNYAFPFLVAARYLSRLSPKDPATITLNPRTKWYSTSPNIRTLSAEIHPLFAWTRDFLITIVRIEFQILSFWIAQVSDTWFWQEIGTVFQRLLASCSQSLEDSRLLFLRRLNFSWSFVGWIIISPPRKTETPYNGRLHGPMVFSTTSWKALQWSSGWITSVVGKGATFQENSTKITLLEWLATAAIKHLVISGQLSLSNIILL